MFLASVLIKRQGRPLQWGLHLSVMETISKIVAAPRRFSHIPCVLAGKLGAIQVSHFTILPLAGHRLLEVLRTITSVRWGKCRAFPVVVRLQLLLPPSLWGIQVDCLMHDQGNLDDPGGS